MVAPRGRPAQRNSVLTDRAAGVLLATAADDALGVPDDFTAPPTGDAAMLGGGLGDYASEEYSDDTQTAVCIARVAATGADLTTDAALNAAADASPGTAVAPPTSAPGPAPCSAGSRPARESAQRLHTAACARAVAALTHPDPLAVDSCVLCSVTGGWAWRPQGQPDEDIPEEPVHPSTEGSARFTGRPLLAVEVLSTHRSDDLVLEAGRHARAGLPHCWVIDPRDRVLDAYLLSDGLYRLDARVAEASGPSTVRLERTALDVDLTPLLRS